MRWVRFECHRFAFFCVCRMCCSVFVASVFLDFAVWFCYGLLVLCFGIFRLSDVTNAPLHGQCRRTCKNISHGDCMYTFWANLATYWSRIVATSACESTLGISLWQRKENNAGIFGFFRWPSCWVDRGGFAPFLLSCFGAVGVGGWGLC